MYGVQYLSSLLSMKQPRVAERYKYYEMKNGVLDFGISTPPSLKGIQSVLGWCGKAVDSVADRLQVYGFQDDVFLMEDIFSMNNPDTLYDSAILSALISSCSFISITPDESGFPRLQVIDGFNATGTIDPISGFLTEGYAILDRDNNGSVIHDAYYVPGHIYIYEKGALVQDVETHCGYATLVPIIYRPDAARPLGRSRISRACMGIMQSASRTIKRSEISAEFYSFPQKYLLGVSEDLEIGNKWNAAMSALLTITKDEEGDKPTVGSFQQQSMSPHIDQLRMFASLFAAETGLTVDDLGFPSDNPSSAEAIKSSHENLRLAARKAQRGFGYGFKQAGFLASCMANKTEYQRTELFRTKVLWEPIFEPDASMLSAIGDGVTKINAAVPDYIGEKEIRSMIGR